GAPRGDAKLADLEAAAAAEVARIAEDGVSNEELGKAKDHYLLNMIFAEDNLDWLASIYGSTLATGGTVKD
ncbi:MAG: insulinase family protein, partial [Mesorhizobium sp.]